MYDAILELKKLPKTPPVLGPGQRSWAVRLARRLLAVHGCAPKPWADPLQTPQLPDLFDADLSDMVRQFQHQMDIKADGTLGPITWAWLGCGEYRSLGEVALVFARQEAYLGAREIGGNNRGPFVRRYTGGHEGKLWEWCAAYATWCPASARELLDLKPLGWMTYRFSSSRIGLDAEPLGRLIYPGLARVITVQKERLRCTVLSPVRGDLALVIGGKTGLRHTTLLDRIEGGVAYVMEGNVRPRKWLPWQRDAARPGQYAVSQLVFVRMS